MATKKEHIEQYNALIACEAASGVTHLGFFCPHCRFELNTAEWRERADGLWELVLHATQGGE